MAEENKKPDYPEYNKETGKIIGYKISNRTVGDPKGETKHLIITHKDEIRAWLSN